jgi:hypothetical protein
MRRSSLGRAVFVAAAFSVGCGVAQERSILDRFFAASRLRDTTVLATLGTVVFEPLQQGIVTDFDIVAIAPRPGASVSRLKEVTVNAPVKLPDGTIERKTLVITLERRQERWLVTSLVEPQGR